MMNDHCAPSLYATAQTGPTAHVALPQMGRLDRSVVAGKSKLQRCVDVALPNRETRRLPEFRLALERWEGEGGTVVDQALGENWLCAPLGPSGVRADDPSLS